MPALGFSSGLKIVCHPEDAQSLGHHGLHTAPKQDLSPLEGKAVWPFNELLGNWKTNWFNLYLFWKEDGFHNVHKIMTRKFQMFGPIYREKLGTYDSVNIIEPEDAAILFKAEGSYPSKIKVPPWLAYRDLRKKEYGVILKTGKGWHQDRVILNKEALSRPVLNKFVPLLNEVAEDFVKKVHTKISISPEGNWTTDFTNELFRFALESVCHVLYGTRLGLLQDYFDPESQQYIDAITMMLHTTSPMLYIPPSFLRMINSKIWHDHVKSWDVIFMHADKCIQNIYQDLHTNQKSAEEYQGILCSLLLQNKMPVEVIKANITEMMAGGVDTTAMTIQWTMYELGKHPELQEQLRAEIFTAKASCQGDVAKVLRSVPFLKAVIREAQRLHPVIMTLPRYTAQDIVLQNYFIPANLSNLHDL